MYGTGPAAILISLLQVLTSQVQVIVSHVVREMLLCVKSMYFTLVISWRFYHISAEHNINLVGTCMQLHQYMPTAEKNALYLMFWPTQHGYIFLLLLWAKFPK